MKKYNNRFYFDISKTEQNILQSYINSELNLFNEFNHIFSLHFRSKPSVFNQLFKKIKLIGDIVEFNISVSNEIENIDKLEEFSEELPFLTKESVHLLEDIGKIKTTISNRIKRNMAVEIFRYYASQTSKNQSNNLQYPARLLEHQDLLKKRHIQLHRKTITVEFCKEKNQTLIRIPYLKNKLLLNGNAKNLRWNIMVIHQKPNVPVTKETSWCIDFKNADQDYMIKYLDNPNPRTSFAAVAKDYKKIRF